MSGLEKSNILNYRASGWIAWRIHALFSCIYLLLLFRLAVYFYERNFELSDSSQFFIYIQVINRLCDLLSESFMGIGFPFIYYSGGFLLNTISFTVLILALLHRGMFLNTMSEQNDSRSTKIPFSEHVLNFCRASFYLIGLLLLLLFLLRTGVLLYQDLTFGRPQILIGRPPEQIAK